mmetsp:Transcript_95214/g.254588  ORF Transcript_95214/g.254588 Transcript_95214/m.254588 type:complete len:235 (+) Transcript_95214:587-1291(+)
MCSPRAATSEATKTLVWPALNRPRVASRRIWGSWPWRGSALMPAFSRTLATCRSFLITLQKMRIGAGWRTWLSFSTLRTLFTNFTSFLVLCPAEHTFTTCSMVGLTAKCDVLLGSSSSSWRSKALVSSTSVVATRMRTGSLSHFSLAARRAPGKVAENMRVCRSGRICSEIACSCSSNPSANILSASSSTKYVTRCRDSALSPIKSTSRPGVAVRRWWPLNPSASTWTALSCPP